MKLNALLFALLIGFAAPTAMAATYTYAGPDVRVQDSLGTWYSFIGAYNVADGPGTGRNPAVYSALDAAFNVFSPTVGGQLSDYAVSIYSPFYDPNQTSFDSVLGIAVPTYPPLFNSAGQIVPGQTVSLNALISHTGWYDTWYGIPVPDPVVTLSNGMPYTVPSGTGVGPLVVRNKLPIFEKAEARLSTDPGSLKYDYWNYLTDLTLLDVPPAGYSTPNPSSSVGANPSWSAYVNDHMGAAADRAFFTNYVWKVAPIPEPETYVMMLAGLGLITLMARRRMNG